MTSAALPPVGTETLTAPPRQRSWRLVLRNPGITFGAAITLVWLIIFATDAEKAAAAKALAVAKDLRRAQAYYASR